MTEDVVRVGLLGCGHVGSALVRLITDNGDSIEARDRGPARGRQGRGPEPLARARRRAARRASSPTTRNAVVADPDVDIVVEVIGGIEPARELIVEALKGGKPVVTANKELLANFGKELFETAEGAGVDLLFEASVAGGVPLIRPLRESLAGDRIHRVMGIVNGTTNYILTRMSEEGASFTDALAEAQSLGFAERDPDRGRRGIRRGGEGRDHRDDRVRRTGRRGRRLPRRHQRAHRRGHGVRA